MFPAFEPFESTATDCNRLGTDALLFVLRQRHTAGIPIEGLRFAEKMAVVSIAARDTAPAMLAQVNDAIDLICGAIRRYELANPVPAIEPVSAAPTAENLGPMAPLIDRPLSRPPSGTRAKPDIAF